jgi:hypothetical protein
MQQERKIHTQGRRQARLVQQEVRVQVSSQDCAGEWWRDLDRSVQHRCVFVDVLLSNSGGVLFEFTLFSRRPSFFAPLRSRAQPHVANSCGGIVAGVCASTARGNRLVCGNVRIRFFSSLTPPCVCVCLCVCACVCSHFPRVPSVHCRFVQSEISCGIDTADIVEAVEKRFPSAAGRTLQQLEEQDGPWCACYVFVTREAFTYAVLLIPGSTTCASTSKT